MGTFGELPPLTHAYSGESIRCMKILEEALDISPILKARDFNLQHNLHGFLEAKDMPNVHFALQSEGIVL